MLLRRRDPIEYDRWQPGLQFGDGLEGEDTAILGVESISSASLASQSLNLHLDVDLRHCLKDLLDLLALLRTQLLDLLALLRDLLALLRELLTHLLTHLLNQHCQ